MHIMHKIYPSWFRIDNLMYECMMFDYFEQYLFVTFLVLTSHCVTESLLDHTRVIL